MSNLYQVKDENGHKVKFRMRPEQQKFMDERHGRDIILKARQLGFTTLIQIDMLDECLFIPNTNAGVIAHNRDDAAAFFDDKIKFAYDNLASHIKDAIPAINDATNKLSFANGSKIRVGTSLRSGTFQYLHISEYGKICAKYPEKAKEIKSGAFPTSHIGGDRVNKIVIESTAEGRLGDFFEKTEEARKREEEGREPRELEFKYHFFPWWKGDGYSAADYGDYPEKYQRYFKGLEGEFDIMLTEGQKSWYIQMDGVQGSEMFREFPSHPAEAFEATVQGAYFSKQMTQIRTKGQICSVPIVPGVPIHTFWDLGRDTTSIWFFQEVGFDWRFVDYFANSGEGMMYYIKMLKDREDGGEPYNYGDCYLPHDGTRRSMATEDTPADLLYQNGFDVRIVERTPAKDHSIEHARLAIPQCWFDKVRCYDGIVALDNYRKEWDEKLGTWKAKPLHNEASHGADAFQVFADGYYHTSVVEQEGDEVYGLGASGRNVTTGY